MTAVTGILKVRPLDSADGFPHYGTNVTYDVSTSPPTDVFVHTRCYQHGALVAESWEGFFAGSLDDGIIGLDSAKWTFGGASVTADLVARADVTKRKPPVIASISYEVLP